MWIDTLWPSGSVQATQRSRHKHIQTPQEKDEQNPNKTWTRSRGLSISAVFIEETAPIVPKVGRSEGLAYQPEAVS